MLSTLTLLLVSVSLCVSCHSARARTWYVPADHPTIQGAVDAAGSSDSVIVMPGVYAKQTSTLSQPLVTIDKILTLISFEGPDVTIIDGISSDPDSASIGILVTASLVKVCGFNLQNCYVGVSGSGNLLTTLSNIFKDNWYGLLMSGIGIHVERSTFEGNTIGLACFTPGTSGRVDQNVFVANSHGMIFERGGEFLVLQNTVCFSESTGISVGFSSPLLQNNIIYKGNLVGLRVRDLFPIWNFFCNDVFGNGIADYEGVEDQTGINGNISLDPVFCDEQNHDFGLCLDSPLAEQTCGPMGAYEVTCGYCRTPITPTTWGRLKVEGGKWKAGD
jgi:hypothetical protein